MAASKSVGQEDTVGETIRKRQEDGSKSYTGNEVELKQQGVELMDRVRANGHLEAVLKGLPLSSFGLKKQSHELKAETPCTLLYSFHGYTHSIKTPAKALASLLHCSDLDPEARKIVRAMICLNSAVCAASNAKCNRKK